MKLKTNIALYKKAVTAACNVVPDGTSNLNEQTIKLEALSEGKLLITALSSNSHRLIQSVPAEVEKAGMVYINFTKLKEMSRHLVAGLETLELSLNNKGQLVYRLDNLGSICEPMFHNQDAHRGILFNDLKFRSLTKECKSLNKAISLAGVGGKDFPNIWIKAEPESLNIYSQISGSGYSKYSIKQTCIGFEGYFKQPILKNVDTVGSTIDTLEWAAAPTSLKFVSEGNELIVNGTLSKPEEFDIVDFIHSQELVGKITVDKADLEKAINWQSYQAKATTALTLSLDKDTLLVSSSQSEEAARLNLASYQDFRKIDLPLIGIKKALEACNVGSDLITLSQINLKYDEIEILVLVLEPWEETDINAVVVLYELLNYNT